MKHLESYDKFNEEIDPLLKRAILFLPAALLSLLGKKLFNIYPMLNIKWNEMKRRTTGHKNSPFNTGTEFKIDKKLTKINISDLPKTTLKMGFFLRKWNVYLVEDEKISQTQRFINDFNAKKERKRIYISKDELKTGDVCRVDRLNDRDIYSDEDYDDLPMIILVAKYDNIERVKEIQEYIHDICLEIEDELYNPVKVNFDKHMNYLSLNIKMQNLAVKNIDQIQKIDNLLTDVSERIVDYLKIEKLNKFKYNIDYHIGSSPYFYYKGDITSLSEEIQSYLKLHYFDDNLTVDFYGKYGEADFRKVKFSAINISLLSQNSLIGINEVKLILNNLDKCGTLSEISNSGTDKIEIESISIIFQK